MGSEMCIRDSPAVELIEVLDASVQDVILKLVVDVQCLHYLQEVLDKSQDW